MSGKPFLFLLWVTLLQILCSHSKTHHSPTDILDFLYPSNPSIHIQDGLKQQQSLNFDSVALPLKQSKDVSKPAALISFQNMPFLLTSLLSFDTNPNFLKQPSIINESYDFQVDINSYVTVLFINDYNVSATQGQYITVISQLFTNLTFLPSFEIDSTDQVRTSPRRYDTCYFQIPRGLLVYQWSRLVKLYRDHSELLPWCVSKLLQRVWS